MSFERSELGVEVLRKIWDGSGDPPIDLGRVGGPSRRSWMGRGTLS